MAAHRTLIRGGYVITVDRELGELPDGPRITTVHGVGYVLE